MPAFFTKFVVKNAFLFFLSFFFFVLIFKNTNIVSTELVTLKKIPAEKQQTKTKTETREIESSIILNEIERRSLKQDLSTEVFLPIFLYHYVGIDSNREDTLRRKLNVPPAIFEEQMRTLVNNGYTTVTLYDLVKALEGESYLPSKSFVLTFDDGYEDFYTHVFPVLKRYNLKAINFLILNSINLEQNLKIWQIQDLHNSGLAYFGAHSVSHSDLTIMTREKMAREIEDSKYNFAELSNIPLDFFSYPGGNYNSYTIDAVRRTPYKAAVSTNFGFVHTPESRLRLARIKPGKISGEALLKLIDPDPDLPQGNSAPYRSDPEY